MNFKKVYKPSKDKDTKSVISSDYSWQQSINIPFSEFPALKNVKIGAIMVMAVKGEIGSINEKGISLKINEMSECKDVKEEKVVEKEEKTVKADGKKLKKMFGGK